MDKFARSFTKLIKIKTWEVGKHLFLTDARTVGWSDLVLLCDFRNCTQSSIPQNRQDSRLAPRTCGKVFFVSQGP